MKNRGETCRALERHVLLGAALPLRLQSVPLLRRRPAAGLLLQQARGGLTNQMKWQSQSYRFFARDSRKPGMICSRLAAGWSKRRGRVPVRMAQYRAIVSRRYVPITGIYRETNPGR